MLTDLTDTFPYCRWNPSTPLAIILPNKVSFYLNPDLLFIWPRGGVICYSSIRKPIHLPSLIHNHLLPKVTLGAGTKQRREKLTLFPTRLQFPLHCWYSSAHSEGGDSLQLKEVTITRIFDQSVQWSLHPNLQVHTRKSQRTILSFLRGRPLLH